MLLRTHASTALALAVVIDHHLCHHVLGYSEAYMTRVYLLAAAVLVQHLVDSYGHTWSKLGTRVVPRRTVVHSLPAMLAIAVLIGAPPAYIEGSPLILLIPLSATMLHWIEDLVTEGGVYLLKKRVRLPFYVSYDNGLANRLTMVLFMVLLLLYSDPTSSLFNLATTTVASVVLLSALVA